MKTALFDLDGTLIDSRADLALAINLTRQDFGLPLKSVDEVIACVGEGVRVLVERAIPERPELWDEMLLRQRAHYREHLLDHTVLYPDVQPTLLALKRAGWKLAVVTNKPGPMTRPILEGLGVLSLFDAVVGGGDCPVLKPDPAPLFLAASLMRARLDEGDWMIGDHFTDLEAGRQAGVKRCFCRYGFGEPRGEVFDVEVCSLSELLASI